MSMIGYFYQADNAAVQKIREGTDTGSIFEEENEGNMLCIDKAWHAIHYILTGEEWEVSEDKPISQAILGGEPVNDEDMGYGPMRLIPQKLVSQIAEELEEVDKADFQKMFNLKNMIEKQIYPVMYDENEEEFFEYVWEMFAGLKKFYKDASDKNHNVLIFIA